MLKVVTEKPGRLETYDQCINLPSDVDNCDRKLKIVYPLPLLSHQLAVL